MQFKRRARPEQHQRLALKLSQHPLKRFRLFPGRESEAATANHGRLAILDKALVLRVRDLRPRDSRLRVFMRTKLARRMKACREVDLANRPVLLCEVLEPGRLRELPRAVGRRMFDGQAVIGILPDPRLADDSEVELVNVLLQFFQTSHVDSPPCAPLFPMFALDWLDENLIQFAFCIKFSSQVRSNRPLALFHFSTFPLFHLLGIETEEMRDAVGVGREGAAIRLVDERVKPRVRLHQLGRHEPTR